MQENSSSKNKGTFNILLMVILVILSSLITYFIVKSTESSKREEVVATKDKEISEITEKMNGISKELDEKIKEAKKLGADYKAMETYKSQLESDISALKQTSDLSAVQVKQYQEKVQAYEQMLASKDKELKELKAQNEQLAEEKDSLITETDSLKKDNEVLITTVSEVKESNQKLTSLAAILRAENVGIIAYNSREKQESRSAFRAKKIDKLSVDFALATNNIAQKGNRDIYLRLVEPGGTIVYNAAAGSGQFDMDGDQVNYTLRKQVFYDNAQQKVKFDFNKPKDYSFKEGNYTVELYCDGKQIGYKAFQVQ